ncbi:MAG: nuclear transport factor 2 family protein [Acidobacteriota bacterium]|nr:nuclear transport factor 2 family protein [Acidobacteriota bacterium]
MKKLALLSFIILIFGISTFAQTAQTAKTKTVAAADDKGVRDAFDRLTEGIRQVDAEKVMSVYQNSDKILFFNNNGTATIGWETMKKNRQASYANIANVSLDITGLRVEMLGKDAAYVTCKWKQQQEYDGKLESASGRMTLVFKLIGKDWKVIHLHTSPDNPDAARPVLPSEREKEKTN